MTTAPFGRLRSGKAIAYRPENDHTFVVCGPANRVKDPVRAVLGAVLNDGHTAHLIDLLGRGKAMQFAANHLTSTAITLDDAKSTIDTVFAEVARRRRHGTSDDDPSVYLTVLGVETLLVDSSSDDHDTVSKKHSIAVNLGYIGVVGYDYGVHLILTAENDDQLHRLPGAPFQALTAHMDEVDAVVNDGIEDVIFEPAHPNPDILRDALETFRPSETGPSR
ncbi:hypothetical protein [Curtobacterium sp. MCSS17_016]|uniref:hypothetical protein n=1 Tax=Curtobacterium sp. MCSS17_016 TaxID=2175644 RepID=UPI000DA8D37B|nr:hypothetical protein [Curtobacterium sp. MCSS17_016]WIE81512.1 hypothetical protein DEJ19_019945 [Curtobacterium sp. MCSS17_016]